MMRALIKFNNFAFNRQCARFIPPIRSCGEQPYCLLNNVLIRKTESDVLKQLELQKAHRTTSVLNALANAKAFGISPCGEETNEESLVQGITVNGAVFDHFSIQPSTLYLRKFYPDLLNCLLKIRYSVLTGNPGISKSWFHWYILYQMVNKNVVRSFEVPKLIVRQIAQEQLVFIFPHSRMAYSTNFVSAGLSFLAQNIQHDAVLVLVEPDDSKKEPRMVGMQTILTCSPDQRCYKEFQKRGAAMRFMPVWSLDELKLVGAHIRRHTNDEYHQKVLTPESIADRYYQFGGIIRHVIVVNEDAAEIAKDLQDKVLAYTRLADILAKHDIEIEDGQKGMNISDMLLQYEVNCEEGDFWQFQMVFASEYVKKLKEQEVMSDKDLSRCILQLRIMFQGVRRPDFDLFENIVSQGLGRLEWKIYHKDEHKWVDRKFEFKKDPVFVPKPEEKLLQNMQPFILYRPRSPSFPLVDMLWVEEDEHGKKEHFCIQITFSQSHAKKMHVYEKLRSKLNLQPEEKLNIYFVTDPRYVQAYAKRDKKSFISDLTELERTVIDLEKEQEDLKEKKDELEMIKKKLDKLEFAVIKTDMFKYPFKNVEEL